MISDYEFRLGRRCPTKIFHQRAQLPQRTDDDSMTQWLRDDAGKFHALAELLFPDAVEVPGDDLVEAQNMTHQLLDDGKVIRGARFSNETVNCRLDFVTRDGDTIRIYQVVPRCIDLDLHKEGRALTYSNGGKVQEPWRGALELMSLRLSVVQSLWPSHRVIPIVIVPVKGRTSGVQNLHGCFERKGNRWMVANLPGGSKAIDLLATVFVWKECTGLVAEVSRQAKKLDELLKQPIAPVIDYFCKKCEFNVAGATSGYDLCWGPLARAKPHMFDLYYLWDIQERCGPKNQTQPVASRLAREGRVLMSDIPRELLVGEHAPRQIIQMEGTRLGREFLDPELKAKIDHAVYPIHFLDIETVSSICPVHATTGAGAINLVQFSLHRRDYPGGDLVHVEYLHTDRGAPSRSFLRALRAAVGDHGDVFTWTGYEEKQFFALQAELLEEGDDDCDDLRWLNRFLASKRIVDQNEWALLHWFHPGMHGKTKLKQTLAAAWSVDSPVKHRHPYSAFPADQDPYSVLREKGVVSDGGGAMIAYAAMQAAEGAAREKKAEELLEYCGTDTLAQALLWDYWIWRLNPVENGGQSYNSIDALLS